MGKRIRPPLKNQVTGGNSEIIQREFNSLAQAQYGLNIGFVKGSNISLSGNASLVGQFKYLRISNSSASTVFLIVTFLEDATTIGSVDAPDNDNGAAILAGQSVVVAMGQNNVIKLSTSTDMNIFEIEQEVIKETP